MNDAYYVDLISDLNLTDSDTFDWTGKASSLFCIVAGNVSDDLIILGNTLKQLSENYRGVFFIDGSLEHSNLEDYDSRIQEIKTVCDGIPGVVYMHNHVVILSGVAFVGINGWFGNRKNIDTYEDLEYIDRFASEDIEYLSVTIKNLQVHQDVRKIVVVFAPRKVALVPLLLTTRMLAPSRKCLPGKAKCSAVSVQATVLLSSALFKMLSNAPALWL